MSRYFYARVSSKGQNLSRQLEAAKVYASEYDKIFCDKKSGKNFEREEYQAMKSVLRPGDEVVFKELDRLGRNKTAVKEELEWFKENKITFRILDVPTTLIDFQGQGWLQDMVNNILIEVMTSIAEQEREKIDKRREEGIAAMPIIEGKHYSVSKGVFYGRQCKDIDFDTLKDCIDRQRLGEMTVNECCKRLGIGRSTWYNKIKEVA